MGNKICGLCGFSTNWQWRLDLHLAMTHTKEEIAEATEKTRKDLERLYKTQRVEMKNV